MHGRRREVCVVGCIPLFDHYSSACMSVHVREHTCDINKKRARNLSVSFVCVAMLRPMNGSSGSLLSLAGHRY